MQIKYVHIVSICFLLSFLSGTSQAQKPALSPTTNLSFRINPLKTRYVSGEDIMLRFTIRNASDHPILAIRGAALHDFTSLDVRDGQGKQMSWVGKVASIQYPDDFFVRLKPGESTTFTAIISSEHSGYVMKRPGTYRIRAIFSLSPPDYFKPVAGNAAIPDYNVLSNWTELTVVNK